MAELGRRALVVAVSGGAVSLAAVSLSRGWSVTGAAPGTPVRTSFGSVAVLASSRIDTVGSGASHSPHAGHASPASTSGAGLSADAPVPSAVHGAWTGGLVVEVEVRNRLRRPVELSPGQFRVQVDRDGPTVSLYSADHEAAPLDPGSTRTLRISYLAPPAERALSLVFADTGSLTPVDLGAVGRRAAREVWS